MTAALAFCFTVSGAVALALEMLWMRSAALVCGQTAATTAAVLACYFGGIGLGAVAGRRVRASAARVYGWLEIGSAAGALWSLGLFELLAGDAAQGWLAAHALGSTIMAIVLAVLPATLCLGATLPAIGQALLASGPGGRASGWLYAANTAGGVAGIVAVGFGAPAALGVRTTYIVTAAVGALIGTLALSLAPRLPAPTGQREGSPLAAPTVSVTQLRLVAAGGGALGLGLEVIWMRLFAQVLHNSVYSFSAVALVFVAAIAAGAALAAILMDRIAARQLATGALVGAGVASAAGVWLFVYATDGLSYVGMRTGLAEYLLRGTALATLCVGPTALASGILLPALWEAWGRTDVAARPLGNLLAANTLGGIAGALATGLVAVPLMGTGATIAITAIAYLVFGGILSPKATSWRLAIGAALIAVIVLNPMRIPLIHLRPTEEVLRASAEGPSGVVAVVEADGDRQLRLDNYYVLGGTAAATDERRLGLLPLLLHPAPHRALFIGMATGITASAGPALGVDATTVVEMVPEVIAAAGAHFGEWNGHLVERPGVRILADDGRRYLAGTAERFDVIVSDLFVPWHVGAGNLYTREMYETAARRLAPGGLVCQWLPLFQLTSDEFAIIAATFLSVFPYASVWRADFYPNRPVLGLVGWEPIATIDLDRVRAQLARLPMWASDPLLTTARGLALLYAGPLGAAAERFAGVAVHEDDRPRIEFLAPRLTRTNVTGDKDWFIGSTLAAFYRTLRHPRWDSRNPFIPRTEAVREAQQAGGALFEYAVAAANGDTRTATKRAAEVRTWVPDVIRAAEAAAQLAAAQRALAEMQREGRTLQGEIERVERQLQEDRDRSGRP